MKKLFVAVFLFAVCFLNARESFAQARRPVQSEDVQKANKRPAATPTPVSTPQIEEPQTDETAPDASILDETDVIEVSTEIVTFPVKVTDRKGRFIPGLLKENFKIFEDKTEQPIEFFNNEQQPFTVALVLDMSYSTTFKISEIQTAAIAFIDQLRKDDKVMVVSFSEEVLVLTEPTSDRQRIYNAIKQTRVASGTSLYEAVDLVVNKKLKAVKGRKAIVLFTDGVDTTSRRAHDLMNLRDVEETDALVYPIRYDTFADVQRMKNQTVIVPPTQPNPIPSSSPNPFPFPIPIGGVGSPGGGAGGGGVGTPSSQGTSVEDYRKAEQYLNDMAMRTGGQIYEANTTANLDRAFSSIAAELREFYSLGYYLPEGVKPGEKRRVKIKVDRENVSVKARDSYMVGKKVKGEKVKK